MERITQRIAVAAAVVLLAVVGIGALVATTEVAGSPAQDRQPATVGWTEPECVIVGDDAERALVEWALGRFEAAELDLPDGLLVQFPDDVAARCGEALGRYHPGDPPVVDLCFGTDRPDTLRELITLHELAHAWADGGTDAETRAAFLEARGLDTWIDPDVARRLWGVEHAAETISWALMEEPIEIVRIRDAGPAALSEAYEVLTGSPVPASWLDVVR